MFPLRDDPPMRIAIAGGHGRIGSRLIRLLAGRGDEVVSLDRNPAYGDEIRAAGGQPVVCDLEVAEADEVARAIDGADAVVFSAGAGPGSGPERKWTMDHGGAVKLIEGARAAGVPRYVIVSSIGADPDASGDDTFAVYLRAKGRADGDLRASGLEFTIVRPSRLTDAPGTGKVNAGAPAERGEISRDDVAAALLAVLDTPATIGKDFDLTSGETPIAEAIAAL
jgi:uncharacterized protein YbjT (DUF2867 family)